MNNTTDSLEHEPAASEDWTKGYAQGHKEGYQRGMADALPLPTDVMAVKTPCPLPFMLAVMKAFGRKYPKGRMRQVGEWTHFFNEEDTQNKDQPRTKNKPQ